MLKGVMIMEKKQEEIISEFRTLFAMMMPEYRKREVIRLNRIVKGKPPIILEPLDDPTRLFRFSEASEVIKWLNAIGIEVRSNSNIYKCLRGERKNAYGYKIYYGEE